MQKIIYTRADGKQQRISRSKASDMVEHGTANWDGESKVIHCDAAYGRNRFANIWVKDRGVRGGRYGKPFEPNGNQAQFYLAYQ